MLADGADAAPDLVDMCARYIQASASSSGGAGWASCHTAAEMCELVVGVLGSVTTVRVLELLQRLALPRVVIDKTPSYIETPSTLRRAEPSSPMDSLVPLQLHVVVGSLRKPALPLISPMHHVIPPR